MLGRASIVVALVASSLGLARAVPAQDADAGGPPSVLFLVVDDLNDWTGCLGGHPQATTPNLDRLAERGVLFTNAHCAAPLCNPSRVAVLTGIAPHRSGVWYNEQVFREVLPSAETIVQAFAAAGYRTARAGKVLHNLDQVPEVWDQTFPRGMSKQRPLDPEPPNAPLQRLDAKGQFDWGPVDTDESNMSDAQVAAWVAKWLGVERKKPFFLACGIYRPHLPWYLPRAYFRDRRVGEVVLPDVVADDLDDVPGVAREVAHPGGIHADVLGADLWSKGVRAYLAAVEFADARLGTILDALWSGPNADDTIVVLWSDHGYHLGEKSHWGKDTLWEESTRVPLVVAGGPVPRGVVHDAPVSLLDLFPTLIELCGLPARTGLDGESLVPLFTDPRAGSERVAITTLATHHALRTQRWRYVLYDDGSEELYDHDADPNEWTNLAADPAFADERARLRATLKARIGSAESR